VDGVIQRTDAFTPKMDSVANLQQKTKIYGVEEGFSLPSSHPSV
jgi:hypothetical protein